MEKRRYSRTSLINDYNTQFRLAGQAFSNIKISNIGTHGCCLQLPVGAAKYLRDKPVLDNMILFHADQRKYSLRGRVAWYDAGAANLRKDAWIQAGVEFLDTPEECTQELTAAVEATGPKG